MHPTCQKQRLAAEQVCIFSSDQNPAITDQKQQCPHKTAQEMRNVVSWEMTWHQPLKHNWGVVFKLSKGNIRADYPSTHCTPTTNNNSGNWHHSSKYHREWNIKTKNIQRNRHEIYWVCDKIQQNYFHIFWEEVNKTWRVMSQNTTQYGTTELGDQDIWNQQKKK